MPKLLSIDTNQHFYLRSIAGLLRLVRTPNLIILALTQYLTRIFLVGPEHLWKSAILDPRFSLLVLSNLLIASAGYIINDYYDIKIDTVNKPERVIIGKIFRRRVAMAAHTILNLAGIAIGL